MKEGTGREEKKQMMDFKKGVLGEESEQNL